MKSVPMAIAWEMLRFGFWRLVLGMLGANLIPVVVLGALSREGGYDPSHSSMVIMHVTMIQMIAFTFAFAVFWAQQSPSRLFTKPLTTAAIVHWHLLPTMLLVTGQCLLSTLFLNAAFDVRWPLWGSALFAGVFAAAIQAAFWLTEKSGWLVVAICLVGGVFGLWFKSQHGPMFSQPTHYWSTMEPADFAALVAFVAFSYGVACLAIARNRRNSPELSLGIINAISRFFDSPPADSRAFRSRLQAQFWFEWRQKGWLMPTGTVFGILVGIGGWVLFSRDAEALIAGFIVGGAMLSVAAFIAGATLGQVSGRDGVAEIGPFLATRPITTSDFAQVILKVAALSVFLAWLIWAGCFLGLYVILATGDSLPNPQVWENLGWWYFPVTLAAAWTIATVFASMVLAGRSALLIKLLCGVIAAAILLPLLMTFTLSEREQMQFVHFGQIVLGIFLVLLSLWFFGTALRRILIGWQTVSIAVFALLLLFGMIGFAWREQPAPSMSVGLLLIGLSALAVAPLAAAPLALAWNRTR